MSPCFGMRIHIYCSADSGSFIMENSIKGRGLINNYSNNGERDKDLDTDTDTDMDMDTNTACMSNRLGVLPYKNEE